MVKEQIRCNVVHIGVVLDVRLREERDEKVQASTQKEHDIEGDENEEDLVRHDGYRARGPGST